MLKKSIFVGAMAMFAVSAQAATVVGTFAAALSDVSSSTFGIREGSVLTNAGGFVTGRTGDMSALALGTTLTFSPVTATNGTSVSFTSSFGSFLGTIQDLMTMPAPNAVVSFNALGNFTPGGTLSAFETGLASLTVSFTQTGILTTGGAQPSISGSFTFASPPSVGAVVPEPAAWAMLIAGFGLTGAAMRRRAARSVAA